MQVLDSPSGRAARVMLSGELDIASADRLRQTMLRVCLDRELVLVDMEAVSFIDSTIIGVLVAAAKRCSATGGTFLLSKVHGDPRRTLELVGLNGLLLPDGEVPGGLEEEFRQLEEPPAP